MAAALTATGAAGAAGMARMGSVAGTARFSVLLLLPQLLDRLGLRILNRLPNAILQPFLIVLLLVSVSAAYVAYRGHGLPQALVLTVASALAMYVSIYVWMSDLLYLLSLLGLFGAGVWAMYLVSRAQVSRVVLS